MNYQAIHDRIILRAQNRLLEGYSEKHHIIPKCMGGSNDPSNLVSLTAREHFVVHQLLVQMYPHITGLAFAASFMTTGGNGNRINNRVYGWLKQKMSLAKKGRKLTEETKQKMSLAKKGEKHGMHGRKHTEESKQKIGLAHKGEKSARYGKKHTEETKQKMSLAQKGEKSARYGKKHTEETKEKMCLARKGKNFSE